MWVTLRVDFEAARDLGEGEPHVEALHDGQTRSTTTSELRSPRSRRPFKTSR